jgi:predicted acyltransferase
MGTPWPQGKAMRSNVSSPAETPLSAPNVSSRLVSVDAYRGFVMFLMVAEIFRLSQLKVKFPDSSLARWISYHTSHVEWVGCSLHDLIQPSFSFLVGAAMAFSLVKRARGGQSKLHMVMHAAWRSLVLILLGVFLVANWVGLFSAVSSCARQSEMATLGDRCHSCCLLGSVRHLSGASGVL